MKDAGLFLFEDDDSVLFVRTPPSLHGSKGILRSRAVRPVFPLEIVLGVRAALKLGETCTLGVYLAPVHGHRKFGLFWFTFARFALTSRRVLDLDGRRAVGRGVASTATVMGIIFRGKGHGRGRVRIRLASRDRGWLGNSDNGRHGRWTASLEPTATQGSFEEWGSEEEDLLVGPITHEAG